MEQELRFEEGAENMAGGTGIWLQAELKDSCSAPAPELSEAAESHLCVFRHGGIYRADGGLKNHHNPSAGCRLPLVGPRDSVNGRDGRDASCCSSSTMSSGRLFLDRVARQQCPSPLHRQCQTNIQFPETKAKGDVSTLLAGGHFYFALTPRNFSLAFQHA
jgi:hypothetical protein